VRRSREARLEWRKIATKPRSSGRISVQAQELSSVRSSAITPTTTLSGPTTVLGSAESQNDQPGNP
jgi:hypothetical protein